MSAVRPSKEWKVKKMYMKDLKHKMTLRLNDELLAYVNDMSDQFGISPSDFIRQCVATHKDAREKTLAMIDKMAEFGLNNIKERGFENGIDRKTNINSKLQ